MSKIVFKDHINICLDRQQAEEILAFVKDKPSYKHIQADIERALLPRYEYKVKCQDCGYVYTFESTIKYSQAEVDKGGLCAVCSDDYK